jgi:hypothetical protein
MISQNPYINCTNARLYYYDFLNEETGEGIPNGALQHIKQCRNCQIEVDRLKGLLEQADERFETEQSRRDSTISTLLKLHFDYINEPVKCETVKSFLASLADPVLQIRVPTPITTHLGSCRACRNDLKILRDLRLPHKYLCRLGQLLADKPIEDDLSCLEAQAAIPAVVSMTFHETTAEILEHVCTCPDCRKRLYLHRQSVLEELKRGDIVRDEFPCESVSYADVYDYCLPYGIDPADDEYNEFRESLASHLRTCPTCLAKMQELHRKVSNIAGRAESGVITAFNIDGSTKIISISEPESPAALPVGSEIAGTEDSVHASKPASFGIITRLKEKTLTPKVKPLLKIGLAAAAVIAIGFTVLFNSPAAGAVNIQQIYRSIENARNICVERFDHGKTVPSQNICVSRALNICITKTGEESVLLDLANRVRKEKIGAGHTETLPLSAETIAGTKEMMAGFLGLVPFDDVSFIPKDIEWKHVKNNDLEFSTKSAEIYELTWIERSLAGNKVFKKWRVFLDPETYLPEETEFYTKGVGGSKYILDLMMKIEYLSDSEMAAVVSEVSL